MTSGHAPLAPSAAHRWLACSGSVRLCAPLPDQESEHAALGTFAHDIAALCLENGSTGYDMLGKSQRGSTVDEEMAEAIDVYLDAVRELRGRNSKLHVETRVWTLCEDVYGTADAVIVSLGGDVVDVVDYKHGAGVFVDVENNPQLRIYALGAIRTLNLSPWLVRCHVVQPRHHRGGWSTETLRYEELLAWAQDVLIPGVARTEDPEAPLSDGPHCRFCRAKAICPKIRNTATERTKHLFADASMKAPAKTPVPPSTLSDAQLGEALDAFPVIEQWMKAVREVSYDRANAGHPPAGYKLVEKTGNRKWINEEAAKAVFEAQGTEPWAARKLMSPAQAEKVLSKTQVADLVTKPVTGTVLVSDSDKRPAIKPGSVFEEN